MVKSWQHITWGGMAFALFSLCVGLVPSSFADVLIREGALLGVQVKGRAQFQNFNTGTLPLTHEVLLYSTGNEGVSPWSTTLLENVDWNAPGLWGIRIEYAQGNFVRVFLDGPGESRDFSAPVPGMGWGIVDYVEVRVKTTADAPLHFSLDSIDPGGLHPLRWDSNSLSGDTRVMPIIGLDLTWGFELVGTLTLPPNPLRTLALQLEIIFGEQPRGEGHGPLVSQIQVTEDPALLHGTTTVTALVDDGRVGNSPIAFAEYILNRSPAVRMSAEDGAFDSPTEAVAQVMGPLTKIGRNVVCVLGTDTEGSRTGTDVAGNQLVYPCMHFTVAYDFEGFYPPLDSTVANEAKAGQTIPVKWRVTDAHGDPISDPAHFVRFFTYPVDCESLLGIARDIVDESPAGDAGLQYLGEGVWQFNWKTAKWYAETCRRAYIEFNSGTLSPFVSMKFTK